ncbi:hypothetical protein EC973_008891 [Apophysomyces ossiformis]|uniref:F-box domain-containing protein n=1 Tax=Apophysomyces ossiformis TaxID=679940 RepID=A0A8H7BYK6_9FUNG|nr:hypothetical protein EC973_008891 [Apophysomyces ossiformis]
MADLLPDTILLDIFSYLPLLQRWRVASVCHRWYRVCLDPYLYRHVYLEDLEFKKLVLALQRIITIGPKIQTLTIRNCYSEFIQNTVVPIHFSNQHQPLLFSHIRALQPTRRRQEYLKHGFELHNQFSDAMNRLLELNQDSIRAITILGCDLDFEMTELFCAIPCFGKSLTAFVYANNADLGLHSSGLLQAIVATCPNIRHFRGLHTGIDDAVLMTMARHWPFLESLTLSGVRSRATQSGQLTSTDQDVITLPLTSNSPAGSISSRALWELVSKCKWLHTLELHDLACISNRDLAGYEVQAFGNKVSVDRERRRFRPYHTAPRSIYEVRSTQPSVLPGTPVRHLRITKYTTVPLSKPGFESLCRLFPNLQLLEYYTNFYAFDNRFEGVTQEMFETERKEVDKFLATKKQLTYHGYWYQPITAEQRLLSGMTIVSEHL